MQEVFRAATMNRHHSESKLNHPNVLFTAKSDRWLKSPSQFLIPKIRISIHT